MSNELSAIIFFENGWQVAQCVELDVASQGNTAEEAFQNLKEAVMLFLDEPKSSQMLLFAESLEKAQALLPKGILRKWTIE